MENKKTLLMGIVNVTPDSFFDGGKHDDACAAADYAKKLIEEGADIIDVGGESTRPGFQRVTTDEELARTIPVIKRLNKECSCTLSVDTTKYEVAKAAVIAGASIVNDISFMADERLLLLTKEYGCRYVLTHNKALKKDLSPIQQVMEDFEEVLDKTDSLGIDRKQIIIDPGIGFNKNAGESLSVLKNLRELKRLGNTVLLGISRKSFIGDRLGLSKDERLEATLAADYYGVLNGADILRIHDVKSHKSYFEMIDLLYRS